MNDAIELLRGIRGKVEECRPVRGDGSEIVDVRLSMWAEEHRTNLLRDIDAVLKLYDEASLPTLGR